MQDVTGSALEDALLLFGLVDTHVEAWLWMTLVLMVAEIFTMGFFLGAVAVSTLITSGAAAFGLGPQAQLVVFSASGIASLIWIRPVFVRMLSKDPTPTNTEALVGSTGTVVHQVPAGGVGRVRLANEEWRATSEQTFQIGDAVRVLAVKGNTLTVGKGGTP